MRNKPQGSVSAPSFPSHPDLGRTEVAIVVHDGVSTCVGVFAAALGGLGDGHVRRAGNGSQHRGLAACRRGWPRARGPPAGSRGAGRGSGDGHGARAGGEGGGRGRGRGGGGAGGGGAGRGGAVDLRDNRGPPGFD